MTKTLPTLTEETAPISTAMYLVRNAADAVDKRITQANLQLALMKQAGRTFNPMSFGAKFDGKKLTNITTTNGNATVTSTGNSSEAAYTFTAADVGKVVLLYSTNDVIATCQGRGTISSVSSNTATLSFSATATVAGTARLEFGTDDTAALQACLDACNTVDVGGTGTTWTYSEGGCMDMPAGMTMITAQLTPKTNTIIIGKGYSTIIKWASTHTMASAGYYAAIHFSGDSTVTAFANGSTRVFKDCQVRDLTIDMTSAFTTVFSYHSKCIEGIYLIRPVFSGLQCLGSPATSIGCDYVIGGTIFNNKIVKPGRLWTSGGGGSSGMDFQTDFGWDNNKWGSGSNIFFGNHIVDPAVSGIRNTDNHVTLSADRTVIANNMVITKLTSGKGIEDNGNTGAIIIGNVCVNTASQSAANGGADQEDWGGILSTGGNYGQISNNFVSGYHDSIRLTRFTYSTSTLNPSNYLIQGNQCKGAYRSGIRVQVDNTYSLDSVAIQGNKVQGCGSAGIALSNTGSAGTITNVKISGNSVYDIATTTATDIEKSAILINTPVTGLMVSDNHIYNSAGSTGKYGLSIDTVAVSDAFVTGNHMSDVTTSAISLTNAGTLAGEVTNNKGYHLGAATVSVTASPMTYTAGVTPEVLYVVGGTVTSIVKDGRTISSPIYLNPNESVVVTYAVAPTMEADKK